MERRPSHPQVTRSSAALFGLIVAAATVALVVPLFRFRGDLEEGDVASRTFTAVHDAQFQSESLTEAAREEAARGVEEVALPIDQAVVNQQVARVQRYLDQVAAILERTDENAQRKQEQIAALTTPKPLTAEERAALQSLGPRIQSFKQLATDALKDLLSVPLRENQVDQQIRNRVDIALVSTSEEETALTGVLRAFTVPTFRLDEAQTARKREEARQQVAPVFRTFTEGQVIVAEGQEITAQEIEALKATGVIEDGIDFFAVAGGAVFAVGAGLLLGAYAYLFQPFSPPANRRMVLVAVAFAAVLLGARLVLPLVTPDSEERYYMFALPVATAAIVAASFADLSFAALVAVVTGLFAAFIGGTAPQIAGSSYIGSLQGLELATAYTAGGLAGAAVVHRASRLGRFVAAAFAVAIAVGAVIAAFWLVSAQRENVDLAWAALAAGIHGLASAVLAVGVFVVLSMVFGVTTRLQLMELAQADHPLLRRLQEEAPGTYHHSMLVGALAERAAVQVGADPLLVRVGAYYHDIGKLAMPGHYVENMLDGAQSPHDSLPPAESAAIIRAHVTNGLDIARKYRLPAPVRDFIPQHHGTRLVTFFYRRAAAQDPSVDASAYRYGGPRPQSREAAIVMLADSAEAVARARQDDSTASLDQIVDAVFAERLAEGQLDECDITLKDLQAVAASFKATLRAVYHPRVQYPSPTPEEIASLARGETPLPG